MAVHNMTSGAVKKSSAPQILPHKPVTRGTGRTPRLVGTLRPETSRTDRSEGTGVLPFHIAVPQAAVDDL
jgi:hypothetical protein